MIKGLREMLRDLEVKSFSIRDDFIPQELALGLLDEFLLFEKKGLFRQAGIGQAVTVVNAEIRGDETAWLTAENSGPSGRQYQELMEILQLELNKKYFFGLNFYECHFARYAQERFYSQHMDAHSEQSTRRVSTVLYLNESWKASDGGLLRLYDPAKPKEILQGILPVMGRFVTFLSDEIPHEVTESHRERRSLTGWFHRRRMG